MKKQYGIFIIATSFLSSCMMMEPVDLIVHNATIYTLDPAFSKAQAMAVRNGKIISVGAEREILNKYMAAQTIDAAKKPVYPGFIDAHCHFLGYGLGQQSVNLAGTKSFDEVMERVIAFVEKEKNTDDKSPVVASQWITGRGWDQNDWEKKEFPDNSKIDSLFPGILMLLTRIDGHAAIVSSAALNKAGITTLTKTEGGIAEIKNGRLTGILIDNAIDMVKNIINKPGIEQLTKALLHAQKDCFSVGLTTVDDAGLNKAEIDIIDTLHNKGMLKMRIYAMLDPDEKNFEHYEKSGIYITDKLSVRSFKFYADGALGSRGARLIEPYSDQPDHTGLMLSPPEYFVKNAKRLIEMGFQMNTHCIGDSANRLMLDIYEDALGGINDLRWRIEHAQVINPSDFRKFNRSNIIPSVQPTHATSDMYWAGERLGDKREKSAYAYQELLKQNGLIALGSDFPVESINPLLGFYAAVARKDAEGFPETGYLIENALTRKQALMGMTIWAAIANFEENEKGSLEAGKFADFVILERDIMNVDLEEIPEIKVSYTFVGGEQVYPYLITRQ